MPAPEPTPDDERTRATTRPVLWFALVMLAAVWFSALNPPWPMPLLSGVLALAAVVLGVVALRRLRKARAGGAVRVLVALGMGLGAAMIALTAVQALMWPVYADFYACLERSVTHQAQRACLTGLEDAAQHQLIDLLRQPTSP